MWLIGRLAKDLGTGILMSLLQLFRASRLLSSKLVFCRDAYSG
jgi:hypothetical protein